MALPAYRYISGERLLWIGANKGDRLPTDSEIGAVVAALADGAELGLVMSPETMEDTGYLQLRVPFFSPEQVGAASRYGPVSLEVILAFCEALDTALSGAPAYSLVCVVCSRRPGAYPNSLLLLGAFLILERKIAANEVVQMLLNSEGPLRKSLPASEQRFPPPWKKNAEWSKNSLTIRDCLEGLEVAARYGWLDCRPSAVEAYRKTALAYDCVPVFSVRLASENAVLTVPAGDPTALLTFWAGADPVTTVVDPQRHFKPVSEASAGTRKGSKQTVGRARSFDSFSVGSERSIRTIRHAVSMVQQRLFFLSEDAEVAKARTSRVGDKVVQRPADMHAFGHWLRDDLRCRLVARVNYRTERNLPPGGSYEEDFFEDHFDIAQLDLPFTDGTAPPPHVVSSLVSEVRELMLHEGRAGTTDISVLVHCKSGLGRSMSCLGALATALVPGLRPSAFFGWARLVRPGAIQTRVQEDFLRSLEKRTRTRSNSVLSQLSQPGCKWFG